MIEAVKSELRLPKETLKLVTQGRSTSLPHIVRIRYVQTGTDLYALGGSGASDWVRNVMVNEKVRIKSDFLAYEAAAEVSQVDKDMVLEMFRRKYGKGLVDQWYGKDPVCVKLTMLGEPTQFRLVKGEGDASKSFSQWRAERKEYYGDVATAFDSASEEYDVTIGRNYINTWIRQRSLEILYSLLRREDTVLEIGAGTGAEAVQVSKRVTKVVATDISPAMVDLLTKRAAAKRLGGRLIAIRLAAGDIAVAKSLFPEGRVRVAYSFNGALNCEPRLDGFVEALSEIIVPGGYFVCSIRNTLCLTEMLTYGAILRYSGMVKRKVQPMMVSVGGTDIPSTYYSVGDFASHFKKWFETDRIIGLPSLVPPAYMNDYYVRARQFFRVVEGADRVLGARFPLNRLGDQTLFVFRRR